MPRTYTGIYIPKGTSPLLRTYINMSSLYHSSISSSCSAYLTMVVWKGLRKNNVNHWPECFLRKLSKVTSQVDVMLWSIERSCHDSCGYLSKSLSFTCLRQELQQKRSYKALKFLNCKKYIFLKKSNMAADCWVYMSLAFKGLKRQPRLMSHLAVAEPLKHIPFSFFKTLRRRRVTSSGEPLSRPFSFFKTLTSTDELSSPWAT